MFFSFICWLSVEDAETGDEEMKPEEVNLLVTSAIDPALVFWSVAAPVLLSFYFVKFQQLFKLKPSLTQQNKSWCIPCFVYWFCVVYFIYNIYLHIVYLLVFLVMLSTLGCPKATPYLSATPMMWFSALVLWILTLMVKMKSY